MKDSIIKLTKEQLKPASVTLARAFYNYSVSKYMRPNPKNRLKRLKNDFKAGVCVGLRHGEVYATSNNLEGVSVWMVFEEFKEKLSWFIRCSSLSMLFQNGIGTIRRVMRVMNCMTKAHEKYAPGKHYYLSILGIDPDFQGKGFGSLLIGNVLEKFDKEDPRPAYVETNETVNVPFYEKLGFKVKKEMIIPKTDVPVWFMLRD